MFDNLDFSKLPPLFKYNIDNPMIFSSGIFLFLFLIFLIIYSQLSRRILSRIVFVTLFSIYFYYKSSGFYFLLLIFISLSDYFIGHALFKSDDKLRRRLLIALSLVIDLGILVYFKYTNMFVELYNAMTHGHVELLDLFLPIGISFFTFQSISYVLDISRRRIKPLTSYLDYIFYISFFPQLVAGPIVRAHDFIPQIRKNPVFVSREWFGEGTFLIAIGLFKKGVISDYISSNFVDRVFDNPLIYSGFENLLAIYGYAIQIYCDFSGYSDMAIGIALLLGFRFNINFNSPYKSATITEFWRRWHISLSSWLKDYLYISLGGNRNGNVRTYINLMITMILGGLWHGASLKFVIWGFIHGVSLGIHKALMGLYPGFFKQQGMDMPNRFRRIVSILITFHIVCFAWVFFRADTLTVAGDMFRQIFTTFRGYLFYDFIISYKYVIFLIILGYVLHFASDKLEDRFKQFIINSHFVVKVLFLVVVVWIVMQTKNVNIQPFIYFQF